MPMCLTMAEDSSPDLLCDLMFIFLGYFRWLFRSVLKFHLFNVPAQCVCLSYFWHSFVVDSMTFALYSGVSIL